MSSRGEAPVLGFADVLLAGLAADGGLYLPAQWPRFTPDEIRAFRASRYPEVALAVFERFTGGEIESKALERMVVEAYATFPHPAVAPLVQVGPRDYVLELFHGPTLAFKDVAMQMLARLMDHVLAERGQHATVVGATSGDTGGAAIAAFAGSSRTDMFILFPHGRVSPVQQRQMTTHGAGNVHAVAIDGNFDDCQALVKAMFNDAAFRRDMALGGVNSINWARIMAQITYYFTSAVTLGSPDRAVSFSVPTGNFGDIFAGYAAKRMGLPVERLVIATNDNDILARTLATGRHEKAGVHATTSPSMDIEISSNFERLLFEAAGRDAGIVRRLMAGLAQSGAFTLPEDMLATIRAEFDAGTTSERDAAATIREVVETTGLLLDPHTAVGLHVARRQRGTVPVVTLGTAHPAKFPIAVEAASGRVPALPASHEGLMERAEAFDRLPNDLGQVQRYIRECAKAAALARGQAA